LRFKLKPSLFGIKQAKEMKIVDIHPLFKNEQTQDNKEVQSFLQELRNFKPKGTIFDYKEEEKKHELLKKFHDKAEYHRNKKNREKEIEEIIEDSKKEIEKVQKVEEDDLEEKDLLKNKRKRSKMKNFKDNPHYISDKAQSGKNLWGGEKPLDLEELTVNILPDDAKNKQKMVWDTKKKNFAFAKLDEGGRIIRKNESGAVVKGKDKFQAYKNWRKKSKLKIQKVGEEESSKIVTTAFENFKERSYLKRTKQSKYYCKIKRKQASEINLRLRTTISL
jgi:hypothetical protein